MFQIRLKHLPVSSWYTFHADRNPIHGTPNHLHNCDASALLKLMAILLRNATLAEPGIPLVRNASLRVDEGTITSIEPPDAAPQADDRVADCSGMTVIPGLVAAHTHLYSSLAVGMPPPRHTPDSFASILEEIWWKLDRCLDDEAVYVSALTGASRAALCGTTTLVDHHASPHAIPGSLDRVRDGIADVGLRGILCYEVTDRNGSAGAAAGLDENARFLAANRGGSLFRGMVGGHASFTLSDRSLAAMAEIADQYSAGAHIHCAEDPIDEQRCFRETGKGLISRFQAARLLRPESLFAHCTALSEMSCSKLVASGCWVAHNPRSNMNNGVAYAPAAQLARGNLILGTDGIDNDMFAESATAFFRSRDAKTGLSSQEWLSILAEGARFASGVFGAPIGRLEPGAAADLVLLDYDQVTPMDSGNLEGHWFFGMSARHVLSVMVDGKWVVWNRMLTGEKVRAQLAAAPLTAEQIWKRFAEM